MGISKDERLQRGVQAELERASRHMAAQRLVPVFSAEENDHARAAPARIAQQVLLRGGEGARQARVPAALAVSEQE